MGYVSLISCLAICQTGRKRPNKKRGLGLAISFGVFQTYYTSLPQFEGHQKNVALIGTLGQGLSYLGSPVAAYVINYSPLENIVKNSRIEILQIELWVRTLD